ncbi:MAG: ABC transporter ATP-binding protein [bacterium]
MAVRDLCLNVSAGEFLVLIGPSGCGKTTTLKMVNRLIEPTSGELHLFERPAGSWSKVELRRKIGYVIQSVGLLPHLTVAGNIALVPELLGWPKKKLQQCVDELLQLGGMDPVTFRGRYPAQLSGGQQQRIGVLRALAADPELILMDEPFGALDPIMREQLQLELKNLRQRLKKTIIFVTHDLNEALFLADRIVIMKEGAVVQDDTPEGICFNPADKFVASFVHRALRSSIPVQIATKGQRERAVAVSNRRGRP